MVEQFKDSLCLFDLYAEELTVGIDALRCKSRVQGFPISGGGLTVRFTLQAMVR